MNQIILVINSGSSSIKFSIFSCNKKLNLLYHGLIENLYDLPFLTICNANQIKIVEQDISSKGHEEGFHVLLNWLTNLSDSITLKAIGHRIVHGGMYFSDATLINENIIAKIASLNPLAPLHQPHSLEVIQAIKTIYPTLPQVACFDTTFHRTQEKLARTFAIPKYLTNEGVIRYGFHGISYEYISSVITQHIGDAGNNRVIVAHLGNGASMCAMYQCKSIATSMTFSTLDGLMMGTRCGSLDPGVLLYLMQEKKYSPKQIENLLYNESGLLGVSNISHDVRELLANPDPSACEAIELFCYRAALEVGSLSVALKGLDALVFTAGIGENSPIIRKKICEQLTIYGIKINDKANEMNSIIISENNSKVLISVIPTNEENMVAQHTLSVMNQTQHNA